MTRTPTVILFAVGLALIGAGSCRDRESARKHAPPPVPTAAIDAAVPPPVAAALTLRPHMDEHFGVEGSEFDVGPSTALASASAALRANGSMFRDPDRTSGPRYW